MAWWQWSQVANNNANADPSIGWAEGQAPSSINDSARAMMAVTAKYRDDVNGSLTTGGSSTAYTIATNSVYDTLAHLNGQSISFTMNATSGAAPTLNVDSLGAKPIRQATGVALPAGALLSGSVYVAAYNNSTGEFLLLNQVAVLAAGSVNTQAIASAAVQYANIQNVAASRLLGNPTGSAAAPSEITLGAGLSFSGAALVGTLNPTLIPGYLSGLALSTAGSSATFGIAVGAANDTASGGIMVLPSTYTKTTSAWAVGSGVGALDTGTIASSTWYHVHLIERTDTGVVDVLISLSATAPTMPTSYTLSRRIGAMKTNGSAQWTKFVQVGDEFVLDVPVQDLSLALNNSTLFTLASVPPGVSVKAHFLSFFQSNTQLAEYIVSSGLTSAQTPATPSTNYDAIIQTANDARVSRLSIVTNTTAQIRAASNGVGTITWVVVTHGWTDTRGK